MTCCTKTQGLGDIRFISLTSISPALPFLLLTEKAMIVMMIAAVVAVVAVMVVAVSLMVS